LMRKFIITCSILFSGFAVNGQTTTGNITGKVSFISAPNIYVRFTSTLGISPGDTLFILTGDRHEAVLIVNNLSSTSCVCSPVTARTLSPGDEIIARKKGISARSEEKGEVKDIKDAPVPINSAEINQPAPGELKQKIRGSISAFSYTDYSNTTAPLSTRLRYTYTLDAKNIGNSKFSIENYISFNHKIGDWTAVKTDVFNALKIYSLAVKYDLNKTTNISVGRRINQNISSIGAMDGLQVEKTFNKFSVGLLVGTRPDFESYGFNIKLLQYGTYLAFNNVTPTSYNESSVAFMQQTNGGKTDRRFLYFQHSNSLLKNLFFLGTFEVDLYKLTTDSLNIDHPRNTFNPTGVYLSLRYKVTKNFSVSGSYDARKNIMYYETYKSFIDRILEAEVRQGFRLQANYSITPYLVLGVQSGYRFLKSDPNPSRNLYGYLSYSQIPGIKVSATLSATYLESAYMNGSIYSMSLTRDLFKDKIQTGIGYRYVDYKFTENQTSLPQNIAEMNLSWQFVKNMSLSVNYEGTFEKINHYNRFYIQIRKRF
jgi:hypothetical protein